MSCLHSWVDFPFASPSYSSTKTCPIVIFSPVDMSLKKGWPCIRASYLHVKDQIPAARYVSYSPSHFGSSVYSSHLCSIHWMFTESFHHSSELTCSNLYTYEDITGKRHAPV